jgi:hypothetical protein
MQHPQPNIQTVVQQVENWYLGHYNVIGDQTYSSLATYFGPNVSKSQVRAAMMNIAPALAAQGKSLTVPDRSNGFTFRVVDTDRDVLLSWRYRLQDFLSEVIRVGTNAKGCANRTMSDSDIDDVLVEMGNLLGAIG